MAQFIRQGRGGYWADDRGTRFPTQAAAELSDRRFNDPTYGEAFTMAEQAWRSSGRQPMQTSRGVPQNIYSNDFLADVNNYVGVVNTQKEVEKQRNAQKSALEQAQAQYKAEQEAAVARYQTEQQTLQEQINADRLAREEAAAQRQARREASVRQSGATALEDIRRRAATRQPVDERPTPVQPNPEATRAVQAVTQEQQRRRKAFGKPKTFIEKILES